MTQQKTLKCALCKKEIPQEQGIQSKKGIICPECDIKEKKKKKATIIGSITGAVAIAAVASAIIINTPEKVDSFEGVGEINDNITVENVEIKAFDISKAVAISTPTTTADAIDNIEIFKTKVTDVVNALSGTDTQITIPSVTALFALNSAQISPSAQELLREFAKVYCQTNKEAVITIHGYTCNLGTNAHNNALSQNRADAVKQLLVSFGIPLDNIETQAHGMSQYGKLGLTTRESHRRANISIK